MTTTGALDEDYNDYIVWTRNEWLLQKRPAKDAVISKVGDVSHHFGSLWGAIELTKLCVFVCIV